MTTLWRKVHNLYSSGAYDWTRDEPVKTRLSGQQCMCIGGAIAYTLTGNPHLMYHPYMHVEAALNRFADHVGHDSTCASARVFEWNDALPYPGGKETVLRTLEELDTIARTECQHTTYEGVCIFCGRESV